MSLSVKNGGGGLKAAISNKAKMYLSQNYNKKAIFHPSFSVSFISSNTSANDQPKFNSP